MLAKSPKGNLGIVWAAVIAEAEHVLNRRVERQRATDAEVSAGPAKWYLVRTLPGDDKRALRWLARRRFGVFQAVQQRCGGPDGDQPVQGYVPVFPGWLFVFCWDVEKMRARIESSPGVMKLLCDPATNKPVPIDEGFIDRLRALSWVYNENAPHARHYSAVRAERQVTRLKPVRNRINKRTRKALDNLKSALRATGRWEQPLWEEANRLAPHERIALLQRTLNAPLL
jgi:hypothetical protein